MRPFLLHIICIVMLFSSCNWVNDDLSDCPTGTWLKISYTYNILDVDAASSQVGDITIFAFDKNNKYVDRLDVDSIALHQGYCMCSTALLEYSTAMRCAACKASRVFCVICSMFIVRTSFSADSALFWQSRT